MGEVWKARDTRLVDGTPVMGPILDVLDAAHPKGIATSNLLTFPSPNRASSCWILDSPSSGYVAVHVA